MPILWFTSVVQRMTQNISKTKLSNFFYMLWRRKVQTSTIQTPLEFLRELLSHDGGCRSSHTTKKAAYSNVFLVAFAKNTTMGILQWHFSKNIAIGISIATLGVSSDIFQTLAYSNVFKGLFIKRYYSPAPKKKWTYSGVCKRHYRSWTYKHLGLSTSQVGSSLS